VKAEHINPFLKAAADVFSEMLGCQILRGNVARKTNFQPPLDVSGVIGLSGKASGIVVISLDTEVAILATEALVGKRPAAINQDVLDAVGELTNIIAGRAKADLEHLSMKLVSPTVVTGHNHVLGFAHDGDAISVAYRCRWGNLCVEVGLDEHGA
jgi:chemotaxis protein CheX